MTGTKPSLKAKAGMTSIGSGNKKRPYRCIDCPKDYINSSGLTKHRTKNNECTRRRNRVKAFKGPRITQSLPITQPDATTRKIDRGRDFDSYLEGNCFDGAAMRTKRARRTKPASEETQNSLFAEPIDFDKHCGLYNDLEDHRNQVNDAENYNNEYHSESLPKTVEKGSLTKIASTQDDSSVLELKDYDKAIHRYGPTGSQQSAPPMMVFPTSTNASLCDREIQPSQVEQVQSQQCSKTSVKTASKGKDIARRAYKSPERLKVISKPLSKSVQSKGEWTIFVDKGKRHNGQPVKDSFKIAKDDLFGPFLETYCANYEKQYGRDWAFEWPYSVPPTNETHHKRILYSMTPEDVKDDDHRVALTDRGTIHVIDAMTGRILPRFDSNLQIQDHILCPKVVLERLAAVTTSKHLKELYKVVGNIAGEHSKLHEQLKQRDKQLKMLQRPRSTIDFTDSPQYSTVFDHTPRDMASLITNQPITTVNELIYDRTAPSTYGPNMSLPQNCGVLPLNIQQSTDVLRSSDSLLAPQNMYFPLRSGGRLPSQKTEFEGCAVYGSTPPLRSPFQMPQQRISDLEQRAGTNQHYPLFSGQSGVQPQSVSFKGITRHVMGQEALGPSQQHYGQLQPPQQFQQQQSVQPSQSAQPASHVLQPSSENHSSSVSRLFAHVTDLSMQYLDSTPQLPPAGVFQQPPQPDVSTTNLVDSVFIPNVTAETPQAPTPSLLTPFPSGPGDQSADTPGETTPLSDASSNVISGYDANIDTAAFCDDPFPGSNIHFDKIFQQVLGGQSPGDQGQAEDKMGEYTQEQELEEV